MISHTSCASLHTTLLDLALQLSVMKLSVDRLYLGVTQAAPNVEFSCFVTAMRTLGVQSCPFIHLTTRLLQKQRPDDDLHI